VLCAVEDRTEINRICSQVFLSLSCLACPVYTPTDKSSNQKMLETQTDTTVPYVLSYSLDILRTGDALVALQMITLNLVCLVHAYIVQFTV
jgi:hypothetical protein